MTDRELTSKILDLYISDPIVMATIDAMVKVYFNSGNIRSHEFYFPWYIESNLNDVVYHVIKSLTDERLSV